MVKKKNKRKARRKLNQTLEDIESFYVEMLDLMDKGIGKLVKKHPAISLILKEYKRIIEAELDWCYLEINSILTSKQSSTHTPGIADYILGGNNKKKAPGKVESKILGKPARLFDEEGS